MAGEKRDAGARPRLRYEEIEDPEFQKKWENARHLKWDQVELAFRHGFDARDRFAERPFEEVVEYLRQSWEAMGPPVPWEKVSDIVRSGYDRYLGGAQTSIIGEEVAEALEHFPDRNMSGSTTGGRMGERFFLGAAEPVSEYEGEGGPPVEGGKRVRE